MTGEQGRFRMTRAGILNVWQYDDQVFDFADGRLLLRGTNGAGKSKTMEMLLPFVIDGDASRLTASGRHHTSLVWLLLDGYDGQARTGYVWVEFSRTGEDGQTETLTCGVGMRATASAKRASSWFFTSPRRVGVDLHLADAAGPLGQPALTADLEREDHGQGHVFDTARRYREHVGQVLFGLPLDQYDSLLRLIYWLRQPQVGEDIDPRRLAEQLVNALPMLDQATVTDAGATFDQLQAFGEDLDRRERAALALTDFLQTYAGYARSVLVERGQVALDAATAATAARRRVRASARDLEQVGVRLAEVESAAAAAERLRDDARARQAALESGPEARSRDRLVELGRRAADLAGAVTRAESEVERESAVAASSGSRADEGSRAVYARTQELHRVTAEAGTAASRAGAEVEPPPGAAVLQAAPMWSPPSDLDAILAQLADVGAVHTRWVGGARAAVGQVRAAIRVVDEARQESESAQVQARRAGEAAEAVQVRADRARGAVDETVAAVGAAEAALLAALDAWRADPDAVSPLTLPELTADGLTQLESTVGEAAQPHLTVLADERARAQHAQARAVEMVHDLQRRRSELEHEVDPAPAPPTWRRDPREGQGATERWAGAPLWRLVDFRDEVGPDERAGLEAALEGAGLLDAWVTPEGGVLLDGREDVALVLAQAPRDVPVSLLSVLRPDADAVARGLVRADVVEGVLAGVGLLGAEAAAAPDTGAAAPDSAAVAVSTKGTWVVGAAHGRTGKETAQHIGASARAAERARRIAELDQLIRTQESARAEAASAVSRADAALAALRAWLTRRPRHDQVLQAWAREESARGHLSAVEAELRAAHDAARAAREVAAARHTDLVALGERHGLPIERIELEARTELARTAEEQLAGTEGAVAALAADADRWGERAQQARGDAVRRSERESTLAQARAAWQPVHAEHEELAAAAGEEVADLERRLSELRQSAEAAERDRTAAAGARDELLTEQGTLAGRLDGERATLAAADPAREEAFEAFRALYGLRGLVASADIGTDPDHLPANRDEIRAVVESAGSGHRSSNEVLQAMTAVQSGPASTHEPRLVLTDSVYAALARDDAAGDQPVVTLATALTARVAADRELLTERERDLFETHVLSQLGDALRGVRRQADELVAAMNDQLTSVSTSQGIRVRLRWRLREDIPADARRAIELLGQPLGALLPDERTELREALHRLIDLSRTEAPEDSYAEHLARALDYRQWFVFTVQYHRPEVEQWRDLHRKSALSQGEQKVLCYLPLFAAAAAHFTSLAGAAPHAPRFVLLDDAFPKIDARTHPLLFGLLVDLDLDFVVTSERLWGTHASVPSLAIYEALRSPSQRGIAQFEHRWDGQQLTAVGSG